MQSLDRLFWPSLLDKIQEGRVIPVIGPHLSQVAWRGHVASVPTHLARELAVQLDLPSALGAEQKRLADVVAQAHQHDRGADYHAQINRILKDMGSAPSPTVLQRLARITDFKLYVNLGFDGLLGQSLAEQRGTEVQHLGFAPNQHKLDLSAPLPKLPCPTVYSILGKACAAPEFVVSDEDLLEWVTALQDPDNRPPLLFDALRNSHLLFIGCHLQDWLMRILIRLTREARISQSRSSETLIGAETPDQGQLVSFLQGFSPKTLVLDMQPEDFVAALESRWIERTQAAPWSAEQHPLPQDIRPGGVFLSHASEDALAAAQLHQSLQSRQVDTWFDAHRLDSGAQYEQVISRNIGRCGVLVVLLSPAVMERLAHWRDQDGFQPDKKPYFLREWEMAVLRQQMQPRALTILPVRTQDLDLTSPLLPAALRALTVGEAPEGQPDDRLLDAIKRAVRDARKQLLEAA